MQKTSPLSSCSEADTSWVGAGDRGTEEDAAGVPAREAPPGIAGVFEVWDDGVAERCRDVPVRPAVSTLRFLAEGFLTAAAIPFFVEAFGAGRFLAFTFGGSTAGVVEGLRAPMFLDAVLVPCSFCSAAIAFIVSISSNDAPGY